MPQPFSALPDHQRSCSDPPDTATPPSRLIEPLAVKSSSPVNPSTRVKDTPCEAMVTGLTYQCADRSSGVGPNRQKTAVGGISCGYSSVIATDCPVPQLSRRRPVSP